MDLSPFFRCLLFFAATGIAGCALGPGSSPRAIRPIEVIPVEAPVIGYATFQSHNQKVLANRNGIFISYARTRNPEYTAQRWRLARSADGGRTFSTVYEETNATNPPAIETDSEDNIYLFRCEDTTHAAYLYRFLARDGYAKPLITHIPNAGAFKFAAAIDEPRRRLYFMSHNNTFSVVGMDGKLLRTGMLTTPGQSAVLQYPHLFLDGDGTLHAAWTTQLPGVYLYWDIHHMLSRDGGETWRNLDGAPVSIPVTADQTGAAMRITRDDEFDVHTWLSNMTAKDGKLHFAYMAQTRPWRMHYLRYDIASGRRDIDRWPRFEGESIRLDGQDGFFARDARPGSPIYFTMRSQGRLACLVSDDNGEHWHDFARSEQTFDAAYAIGGCRTITPDGWIIGSFTDSKSPSSAERDDGKTYFFRIKAR